MEANETVSVIIPTYHEWHLLKKCLAALAAQSYPAEKIEIIVVNNDPEDQAPADFSIPVNCRIVTEPNPGSYAARNTGVRLAKGNIIAFTDSDCLPATDWIKNAVRYLRNNPACARLAGNISIIFRFSKPTIVEMYNQVYAFPQQWLIANGGGSITGNLFTYKHVFAGVGGFDEKLMSMGDVEWGRKAQRAGFDVHYVDDVIVRHPSRNLRDLIKKERRHGGGAARMTQHDKLFVGLFKLLFQLRPRVNSLRFMLGRKKHLRIRDRLFIPLLRYYLLNIRAFEKFKVQMGKAPNRA